MWELYSTENVDVSVEKFAAWILRLENDNVEKQNGLILPNTQKNEEVFCGDDPEFNKYEGNQKTSMRGAYLVSRMNQYVSYYTKPMMKKYGLHSIDDFGYLQNIKYFTNITKTKACELMLQEITTGVDIIKRLIKNDFITEETNPADKREKLLKLSIKGEQVLNNMYIQFLQIPDTLGTLTEDERQTLLTWLQQLDVHHNEVVKGMGKK